MTVDVEITGNRKTPGADGEAEEVHFQGRGKMKAVSGRYHVLCSEDDSPDGSISRYHMVFSDDEVQVSKKGPSETDLTFRAGETTDGMIRTPYGLIPIRIRTGEIRLSLEEGAVCADVRYDLFAGGELISENHLVISSSCCRTF